MKGSTQEHRFRHMLPNILTVILLYLIAFLKVRYFRSFGGSDVFLILAGLGYYLSIVHKRFQVEIILMVKIMLLLMLINHVAYRESISGFSEEIVVFASTITLLISILTMVITIRPFGSRESEGASSDFRMEIRARVSELVGAQMFGLVIGFIAISIASFASLYKNLGHNQMPLSFSGVLIFWLTGTLLVSLIRGRRLQEEYIIYLVKRKEEVNLDMIRKSFIYFAIGSFLFGLMLESLRGLWIMWILSWTTLLFIVLSIWTTWRYVFLHKEVDETILKPQALPSIRDFNNCLKFIGVFFLVALIYSFAFILFYLR